MSRFIKVMIILAVLVLSSATPMFAKGKGNSGPGNFAWRTRGGAKVTCHRGSGCTYAPPR